MRRATFLIVVALVFAGMAGAVAWRHLTAEAPAGNGDMRGQAVSVALETVRTREFADIVEALGTANANESVNVTSNVSDRISRIAFDSGDVIRAGATLVELSDAEEAAGLSEARATQQEAERELRRISDLADRGIAPSARRDELNAEVQRARARVQALEARVDYRVIRAPFDGVVGLRAVSLGQLVGPGDTIAQLDDISIIKLDFTLPERFLSALEPGMEIVAGTAAFPDEVFTGEITNINSRVDPVARTITVRAEIENTDRRLRPGMLMTVQIRRDVRERIAVPETAITRLGSQTLVFVVHEDANGDGDGGTAEQRVVTTGQRSGGYVEVYSGLETGEAIVSHGVHRVRDGAPVRVQRRDGAENGGERVAGSDRTSTI